MATSNKELSGFAIVVGIIACVLAVTWFGWKMLLVLLLFGWANNLSQEDDR